MTSVDNRHADARRLHLAMSVMVIAVGLLWTWSAGMDLNWDLLNYHFYGAHALLNGRLEQDYFAASFQGYFNPTVFVPFYLLVRAGVPSLLIALGLALVHLINVFLAWRLTRAMLGDAARRSPLLPWLGALLMLVTPLFLTVLGSSFADGLTCVPVLCALLILAQEQSKRDWRVAALLAGLLLGIAGGLKLTNAFLAVCACLTAFAMSRAALAQRVQQLVLLGIGGLAGLLLTHGYWSYVLWRNFGNPVFPLFNNIFQSPDFFTESHVDRRYVMGLSIWERLLLPLRMLRAASWIYSENAAPDLRPLALLLILLLAAAVLLRRRLSGAGPQIPYALRWLTVFYLGSFLVWIFISSNGRYGLPLLLLAGPLLVAWLAVACRDPLTLAAGSLILLAQLALQAQAGNPRWAPNSWSSPWIEVTVPRALRDQPFLYLSTSNQTNAVIAPYLHPRSSLVNIIGQYIQPGGGQMTAKLRRLLSRPPREIRAIFEARLIDGRRVNRRSGAYTYRASPLLGYGLTLADGNCELLTVRGHEIEGFLVPGHPSKYLADTPELGKPLVACAVVPVAESEFGRVAAQMSAAERIFDRVEDACGSQLQPHRTAIAYYYQRPYRNYLNTTNQLRYDPSDDSVEFVSLAADRIPLGRGASWTSQRPPACPRFPPVVVTQWIP